MRSLISLVVVAILSVAPLAIAQHQPYTDEQIRGMLEHDLAKNDITGVEVVVRDGIVTLEGTVRSAWDRSKAAEVAMDIHDVNDVVNQLVVRGGESDQALARQVGQAIERYVFYTVFDAVSATVDDGNITLQGWVTWPFKATEMANHVARITGVKSVRDEIRVLPVSRADDELRARVAVAIYRDLPEFANRAHPPIHVVVNNGRVTLAGAVRSQVEKIRAEHIARSMFGVFSVDNELVVDERASS